MAILSAEGSGFLAQWSTALHDTVEIENGTGQQFLWTIEQAGRAIAQEIFTFHRMKSKSHALAIPWSYQLLFWIAYTLFWHIIFSPEWTSIYSLVTSLIYTLSHAAGSYFNVYWLMPRLWRRHWLIYLLALILTIIASSFLLAGLLYPWFNFLSPELAEVFFEDVNRATGSILGSTFSGITLTLGIYLLLQRRQWEKRQRQLEKEKMEAELQFLRGQLDPHFLFNALNNIYVLIKKNPDQAAEALAGFSDLLRYQIYQAQTEMIPLQDELSYLEQYVELARLRFPADGTIDVQLPKVPTQLDIPPLLLLPLVENAFKFLDREQPFLSIKGQLDQGQFQFEIVNNKAAQPLEQKKGGGIGLSNLRQRLGLIYPDQHELRIKDEHDIFMVQLSLPLQ